MSRHRTPNIDVGDLVRINRECMGNPTDTVAICYDSYKGGVSLLFPNGAYDGFSGRDAAIFGLELIGHVPGCAKYRFSNVRQLTHDYHAGYFSAAWTASDERSA